MSLSTTMTPTTFFEQLESRSFDSYASFEAAVVALFNRHALGFPDGYGWRDALRWGVDHGVVRREGTTIVVRM